MEISTLFKDAKQEHQMCSNTSRSNPTKVKKKVLEIKGRKMEEINK
jgi:hypothetical protein